MQASLDPETLTLRQLRSLIAVAHAGSASAAAKRLFVSQPAITKLIQTLERQLGTSLFHRTRNGMQPTTLGDKLIVRGRRILDMLAAADKQVSKRKSRIDGSENSPLVRGISFRRLRILLAMHETADIVLAADNTGVTRSTVNRCVRDIETILGRRLFLRYQGSSVRATPYGEVIARCARLAAAELRYIGEELTEHSEEILGAIKIGQSPLSRSSLLPLVLAALQRDHPALRFRLVASGYDIVINTLLSGEVDIVVGLLRGATAPPGVEEFPLYDDRLAITVRHDHPLTRKKHIVLDDLQPWGWIIPEQHSTLHEYFLGLFRQSGLNPPADVIECSSISLIQAFMLESDRIGIIGETAHISGPDARRLTSLPIKTSSPEVKIGYALREDFLPTPAISALIDALRQVTSTFPVNKPPSLN